MSKHTKRKPNKVAHLRARPVRFQAKRPRRSLPDVVSIEPPDVPLFDWRTFDPAMIPEGGSFRDELTAYRDRLSWLLEHEGEYVVIKGKEVIGLFPTRDQAIEAAVDRFGEEPVLVKEIVAKEPLAVLGHAVL